MIPTKFLTEMKLRQLHAFWPNCRWDLRRRQDGYVLTRSTPGHPTTMHRASTAVDAIDRAHFAAIVDLPIGGGSDVVSLYPNLRVLPDMPSGSAA